MSDPTPVPRRGLAARLAAGLLALCAVGAAAGFWVVDRPQPQRADPRPVVERVSTPGATAAEPARRFAVAPFPEWACKPDLVLALTGQTHGYLSPCGCSRPQTGGLERRAALFERVRAKFGVPVVGLDLGDVAAKGGLPDQSRLKYRTTMEVLGQLGYAAVALGEDDFLQQLIGLLAEYTLQNPGKPPTVLAANLVGTVRDAAGTVLKTYPRAEAFPGGGADGRPMVEGFEVVAPKDGPAVGVVGVIGSAVADKVVKHDSTVGFSDYQPGTTVAVAGPAIRAALDGLAKHPAKPQLLVLLYQGPLDDAKRAAAAFPEFPLVVCLSDESEPPQFPISANDGASRIIQVGHKGKNVGLVGVSRAGAGWDFQYHLVPLTEEYLAPPGHEAGKANPALVALEKYAAEVRDRDMLGKARGKPLPHSAQILNPAAKLRYVGAEACRQCHPAEFSKWSSTKHAHAYEALQAAKRPALRQYDPECVVCHTTGFEYQTGYANEKATAHLLGNQCENCHGPGSGHAVSPSDKTFLPALSPWKAGNPAARLPDRKFLDEMAGKHPLDRGKVSMDPAQVKLVNAVSAVCTKCHDGENDPNFDFYKYFPQIYHSKLGGTK